MSHFLGSTGKPLGLMPDAEVEDTLPRPPDGHPPWAQNGSPAASSPATPRVRRRNRMITSCLECRRRKLKCDKLHPCTNCTKATRDCVFLAPSMDPSTQLKLTEMKEKMGSLERKLEHDVAKNGVTARARNSGPLKAESDGDEIDFAPEPEDEADLEPTPLAVADAVYDDDADDDLMDLGVQMGRLRVTDRLGGFFRPKISEELDVTLNDARNNQLSTPENTFSTELPIPHFAAQNSFLAPGPTYIPPSSGFLFSNGGTAASLINFLPSKIVADRLLHQYWTSVHPVARLVHRPSFEKRFATFWDEVYMGIEPAGSLQALAFAAMFSGAVSMADDMVLRDFGVGKKNFIDNFQRGTETALGRANILRTTKIESLQAFVMYMIPLCRDEISRAHSALCGTAIRIAECMGLHRDGSAYGLGAIETHVRRMIWYQLCFLDLRTCEAQGPRPGMRKEDFDTEFPLNVDDIELERNPPPIESANRWTDMTATLIRLECVEMQRVVWVDRPRLEKKKISLTALLGKIENFRRTMRSKYISLIDDNIPIQHCGRLIFEICSLKMHIMVLHRYHNSVAQAIPERLRQIILTSSIGQLEASIELETSEAMKPWGWYLGAMQQYHTALLMVVEVFAFPMRKEADRIWVCLDYVFDVPAHLPREEKGRLILTEARDKMGIYRDVRKVRASTSMLERLGQMVPLPKLKSRYDPASSLKTPPQISFYASDYQFHGVADGEALYAPPTHLQAPRGSSDTSSSQGSIPTALPTSDDLMADIDWLEWDRLFPLEGRPGDLNLPPFH